MSRFNFHDHLLRCDHTLFGGILLGIEGHAIELQGRATSVLPRPSPVAEVCEITGMAKGSVREAISRISGAFSKLGIPNSPVSILINLAPAALEKGGAWLDLPLAVLMLQVAGLLPDLPQEQEKKYMLIGELGIHGELRRVPGALSLAYRANPGQSLIVPAGNEKECALILAKPGHEGCGVYPAQTLEEVLEFFRGRAKLRNALRETIRFEPIIEKAVDFGKIRGQKEAKRAAVIAAAGGHNLLMIGPPGEGKSMIASAIPGILPRLQEAEMVELTRIYSAVGLLGEDGNAVTRRPIRIVHHSVSAAALIGGGSGIPRPGEITLAHNGVLFLDELPEFSRGTLEALRQPIESGKVNISRVHASLEFPSRFSLVAAMNPCPCGYASTDRCTCTPAQVQKYQQKISGPLLDRIDLQVVLKPLTTDERFVKASEGESNRLRTIVQAARAIQLRRFQGTAITCNASIPGGSVADYCEFSSEGFARYKELIGASTVTTRTVDRLARVARTVADLASSPQIESAHVMEASQFMLSFGMN
ncbi:Mg chelatase, subunit ChlI [Pirellula staleyi DSM 6068]|uniref:Mg chelatase, subunit ChlI n=1 Tax=Pirellula staleyi (strain ATCC 27377 / DSM 6068 / ICPB 4128) TaxID=530564 RepID=D2R8G7_PIRSD|nr:Mg chelatase, subunit ChlI [Pirellula staleyi DSM 6068]